MGDVDDMQRNNPHGVYTPPHEGAYHQVISKTGPTGLKSVFVAGTVAKNEEGMLVGVDDMAAQMRQCLENISVALNSEDAAMGDVVRRRIFTTDIDRFLDAGGIDVYMEYWDEAEFPTSTLVEVGGLADKHQTGVADGEPTDKEPEFLVEVDVTAMTEP